VLNKGGAARTKGVFKTWLKKRRGRETLPQTRRIETITSPGAICDQAGRHLRAAEKTLEGSTGGGGDPTS